MFVIVMKVRTHGDLWLRVRHASPAGVVGSIGALLDRVLYEVGLIGG
jgi:hypothetical protein